MLSSPGCSCCRDIEAFLIRGWQLIFPGCGDSPLAQGATPAARWLNGPQPISSHPVGLWFTQPAGRYRSGESAFSSQACWSFRYIEGFLIRGWELILPRCGGISMWARGETLAARWLRGPQPIIHHPVALGFTHPAGRYRPGGSEFSSLGCWTCRDREEFLIRGWEIILPGCGGTSASARGATLAAR